jgi:hypothetical protein
LVGHDFYVVHKMVAPFPPRGKAFLGTLTDRRRVGTTEWNHPTVKTLRTIVAEFRTVER